METQRYGKILSFSECLRREGMKIFVLEIYNVFCRSWITFLLIFLINFKTILLSSFISKMKINPQRPEKPCKASKLLPTHRWRSVLLRNNCSLSLYMCIALSTITASFFVTKNENNSFSIHLLITVKLFLWTKRLTFCLTEN